jgi:hypothetical protein
MIISGVTYSIQKFSEMSKNCTWYSFDLLLPTLFPTELVMKKLLLLLAMTKLEQLEESLQKN